MKKYFIYLLLFSPAYNQCDYNSDGYLDIFDIVATINCILDGCFDGSQCEFNGDGQLDILDINDMVNCMIEECPFNGIQIFPGENIQEIVDNNPEGTAFIIKAGVHRMQEIWPKDGNTFWGETGAILNGSRLLTNFVQEGNLYFAPDQTQGDWSWWVINRNIYFFKGSRVYLKNWWQR